MNCLKCGKPAKFRYTVDLDIRGIGMCEEHKDEISEDLLIAMLSNGYKWFEKKYGLNRETK